MGTEVSGKTRAPFKVEIGDQLFQILILRGAENPDISV